jgi:tetratricopeptide (TPR) repeat protein/CHAT domain-containing protein
MGDEEVTHQTISDMFEKAEELFRKQQDQEAYDIASEAAELAKKQFGEVSAEYAKALNDLGVVISGVANDREGFEYALQVFEDALAIQSDVAGTESWHYANTMLNLGELYLRVPDLSMAERYLIEAIEIFHSLDMEQAEPIFRLPVGYGFGPATEASVAFTLPGLEGEVDKTEPSKPQLHLAVNRYLTNALHNLATLYQQQGDFRKAIPLYEKTLDIKNRIYVEEDPILTNSLIELGWVHHSVGNYAVAKSIYSEALQNIHSFNRQHNLGDTGYSNILNDMAVIHFESGNYAEAMQLMRRALDMDRDESGDDSLAVARDLDHMGWIHYHMGNESEAEATYEHALAIMQNQGEEGSLQRASLYNRLGILRNTQLDYASAEEMFKKALRIRSNRLEPDHPSIAETRGSLGRLLQNLGRYEEAEELLQESLESLKIKRGENHPYVAGTMLSLGRLREIQGDYAEAERYYQQAIEIDRTVLGEEHPSYAMTLNSLARVYAATNRTAEAGELLEQVTKIENQMIGQIFSIGAESQRMAYLNTIRGTFYAFLSLVREHLSQEPQKIRSAWELVLRRKGIGAEALAAQRDALLSDRCPVELKSKLQELLTIRKQIGMKTISGPGVEGLQEHQDLLSEWHTRREMLEAEIAEQVPEIQLIRELTLERQFIAAALPTDSVLVEFVFYFPYDFTAVQGLGEPTWGPGRYLAFVVRSDDPESTEMIDLGEAEIIDSLISAFRGTISGEDERGGEQELSDSMAIPDHVSMRSDQSTLNAALLETTRHLQPAGVPSASQDRTQIGIALREKIFDPILSSIGDGNQLFLAPDGDISRLPFEVLPLDEERFLVDEYEISYLSVGRDIMRVGDERPMHPSEPLVIADPDFDLGGSDAPGFKAATPFQPLKGTHHEGEGVAKQLKVEPLMGEEVMEGVLKSRSSPNILHIATHGFFLPDPERDPHRDFLTSLTSSERAEGVLGRIAGVESPLLRSGLALAGANVWLQAKEEKLPEIAEDGILTAEDVSTLNLFETEMVVLSACDTGLGDVLIGEGVFGLQRSFVLAGVKTLVMSLWKVPDAQTQELMEDFYQRLLRGQPRAAALRQAQLALKKRYPDPFYWGAFICQGDPGPLRSLTAEAM